MIENAALLRKPVPEPYRSFLRHLFISEMRSEGLLLLDEGEISEMAKKKAAAKPKYTYFVKKAIQDFAKDNGMMVGSDAYDAFNVAMHSALSAAADRCKENKRKTLKAYDF
jgi:histone H3/H4